MAYQWQHLYTLKPGDKWIIIEGRIIIANPDKIPFEIDIKTGERKEIKVEDHPHPHS